VADDDGLAVVDVADLRRRSARQLRRRRIQNRTLEVIVLGTLAAWSSCVVAHSVKAGASWSLHGIAATPVTLKRGPAVKVVDGPRTETVPREEWPARLDALLESARNVHLLTPDGDLHARRTKKGNWLVSHSKASSETAGRGGARS